MDTAHQLPHLISLSFMDPTPSPPIVNEQSSDLQLFLAIQAQQAKALDLLYDRFA